MIRFSPARVALAVAVVWLAVPSPSGAQQVVPLQKSDIIRLLSGTTYTKAEVAGIIRQSCLSFTPTERDRADFRALEANETVMAAIDRCVRGSDLELLLPRRIFSVPVGGRVTVSAQVRRGPVGAAGVGLRLVGAGRSIAAVTDASGNATFTVPAGTRAGSVDLTVDAGDRSLTGPRAVTVRVTPGAASRVTSSPEIVSVGEADVPVTIVVRDRYGNPVPRVAVRVRAGEEAGAVVLAEGSTTDAGEFRVTVAAEDLGDAAALSVSSGEAALGTIAIERLAPALAAVAFVAGTNQRGEAGTELPRPVVVELRDAEGGPVPGSLVSFEARNGSVSPSTAVTDEAGRASVRVRLGASGTETDVVATAGEVSVDARFPITRGGMTEAEIESTLAQAERLLEEGDAAGARSLFERVVEADPSRLSARIGVAESLSAERRYGPAIERFREILRSSPSLRAAQAGMARASLGAGRYEEAARWFELALSQERTDTEAWIGLGEARAKSGEAEGAREAYEQALELDPGNAAARRGLSRLTLAPVVAEVTVWGGNTFDNGRDASLRSAELHIYPRGGVELWGAFDNALNLRHPYLIRGDTDIKAGYGGAAYSWGPARRYRTAFEFGRRTHPVDGAIQSTWTLGQRIGLERGGWIGVEGFLGHWFDRDDWVVSGEAGIEASDDVTVRPFVSYGENVGSDPSTRDPAKEVRLGLGIRYQDPAGWGLEPEAAYGNVSGATATEFEGGLFDASGRVWYAFTPQVALEGFVRYQSPPGIRDFWTVAFGLRFGVARPR